MDDVISQLAIDTRAALQVRRLSGGNQQKVVMGRWLVGGFRTLLCFDPTRGIDIQIKRDIYALLRKLAAEGAAILLYTSELAEIPLVCDRVLVMHAGRIVDEQDAARDRIVVAHRCARLGDRGHCMTSATNTAQMQPFGRRRELERGQHRPDHYLC